jgi:flagellar protein FliS
MNAQTAANAYKQASIENAPPVKIVRMLYEGALLFIDRAELAGREGNQAQRAYWIGRAEAIVSELRASLDLSVASEVGAELDRLYEYCHHELSHAYVSTQPVDLAHVRAVLQSLLDGWRALEVHEGPKL